jgi:hypothetical protein
VIGGRFDCAADVPFLSFLADNLGNRGYVIGDRLPCSTAELNRLAASGAKRPLVETQGSRNNKRDLQCARNALILLGLKTRLFTVKPLKLHYKRQTLNHRVPGSSPGAPTKPFKSLAV